MTKFRKWKRLTYPDAGDRSVCGGFATTAVAVTIVPLLFVEVLHTVTSAGVVIMSDPFEFIVETIGFDRVAVGCVVTVLVSPGDVAGTTVTSD